MSFKSIGLAAALMLGVVAGPLEAQQPPPQPAPAPTAPVDVSKLPIDLSRLHQKLKESADTSSDPSRLRFKVDVVGKAPSIQIFRPDEDLRYGPVPYAAPTHRDMMEIATPQEFRSPVMDFSNLMRWIQSTLKRED